MSTSRRSILFLTNSEHGQANPQLAVAWELLLRDEYDVHIGSYSAFAPRIESLNKDFASRSVTTSSYIGQPIRGIIYHEVQGVPMMEHAKINSIPYPHSPSIGAATSSFSTCARLLIRDDHDNHVAAYDSMVELIRKLDPVVVVIDMLLYPAHDACLSTGVEYIQLSPGSFYEVCADKQPYGAQLWKYPVYVILHSLVPVTVRGRRKWVIV